MLSILKRSLKFCLNTYKYVRKQVLNRYGYKYSKSIIVLGLNGTPFGH